MLSHSNEKNYILKPIFYKCTTNFFNELSFRSSVVSVKCRFDQVSFQPNVVSIKCRFSQVSFRLVPSNCFSTEKSISIE